MTEANLLDLPVEILHHIFRYCNAKTIIGRIRAVCRRLHNVVDQYNKIELKFELDCKLMFHMIKTCRVNPPYDVSSLTVHPDAVSSLSVLHGTNDISQRTIDSFISAIRRFTNIRHLSLCYIEYEELDKYLKYASTLQLVSLSIKSGDTLNDGIGSCIADVIKKSNLRKLYLPHFNNEIRYIPWPRECQLTHLTINSCNYNQYIAILQQLPHLHTFQLNTVDLTQDNIPNTWTNSQLACLILRDCSLSIEQLKLLFSNTPKLRDLRLDFHCKSLDSIAQIYNWEIFVRTELNFLDKFTCSISYNHSSINGIDLHSIVLPFQTPFWLIEKRWFVASEYLFSDSYSRIISLYTMPAIGIHYCARNGLTINGVLFTNEKYYGVKHNENYYIDKIESDTLVNLDIDSINFNDLDAQYLFHMLKDARTLLTLKLRKNKITEIGIKLIMDALTINNTTLTLLDLEENKIADKGTDHISNFLRNNQTLTTLNLGSNSITAVGIEHLTRTLQNNKTLTTLNISGNLFGDIAVKYIADMLAINITLKEINLHKNKIGNDGIKSLAQALQNNTTLETIDLSNNCITDDGAEYLASVLGKNTTIKIVNLNDNTIDIRGGQCLINKLQENKTLIQLSVLNNLNSYCEMIETYITIKNDPSIVKISAHSRIPIGNGGAMLIADILRTNKTLKEFVLTGKDLNEQGAKYFADVLRENNTLETLAFDCDEIGVAGVNYLIQAVQANKKQTLIKLGLSCNRSKWLIRSLLTDNNMLSVLRNAKVLSTLNSKGSAVLYLEALKAAEMIRSNEKYIYINLRYRYFQSDGIQQIIDAMRSTTIPKMLCIDARYIGLNEFQYFIDEFKNNTTRFGLYLYRAIFSEHLCINTVRKILYRRTKRILDVRHEISTDGFIYLSHMIANHASESLTTLILNGNQMTSHAAVYLAKIITNNTILTTLSFEKNPIDDGSIAIIAAALKNNQTLKTLILSQNGIGSDGAKYLADALEMNTTLTILNLKGNQIGDKGVQFLADSLSTNKTLTALNIRKNRIGSEGVYYLAQLLMINKTLQKLYLVSNKIDDQGGQHLITALENNNTLIQLSIGRNLMTHETKNRLKEIMQTKITS